jgi:hypothetical protein
MSVRDRKPSSESMENDRKGGLHWTVPWLSPETPARLATEQPRQESNALGGHVRREKEEVPARDSYYSDDSMPTNVSADSGLLKEWPKEGLPLAWKGSGSADRVDLAV